MRSSAYSPQGHGSFELSECAEIVLIGISSLCLAVDVPRLAKESTTKHVLDSLNYGCYMDSRFMVVSAGCAVPGYFYSGRLAARFSSPIRALQCGLGVGVVQALLASLASTPAFGWAHYALCVLRAPLSLSDSNAASPSKPNARRS